MNNNTVGADCGLRKALADLLRDYEDMRAAYSDAREAEGWDSIEEDDSATVARKLLASD